MSGVRIAVARRGGPLPWLVAVMVLLTMLATAAALALGSAAGRVRDGMAERITVQIVEADAKARERQAAAAEAALRKMAGVKTVRRVPQAELNALLAPWLGSDFAANDIAVPAMIDADLDPFQHPRAEAIGEAVRLVAPAARIDDHGRWLAPLDRLLGTLRILSLALVILVAGAMVAVVILAARAAFDAQRETVALLHMLGATDRQVARLFERRIGGQALAGGLGGAALAALVLVGLAQRMSALGSDLAGGAMPTPGALVVLLLVPFAGTGLAMLTTRLTIMRNLGRMP